MLSGQEIEPVHLNAPNSLPHNCNNISYRDGKEVKETTSVERSIEIQEVIHNDLVCDTNGNTPHSAMLLSKIFRTLVTIWKTLLTELINGM